MTLFLKLYILAGVMHQVMGSNFMENVARMTSVAPNFHDALMSNPDFVTARTKAQAAALNSEWLNAKFVTLDSQFYLQKMLLNIRNLIYLRLMWMDLFRTSSLMAQLVVRLKLSLWEFNPGFVLWTEPCLTV
jgi:hypothetical protein